MLAFGGSYVVEKSGVPGENHRLWMDERYPAICYRWESNPGRSSDKREIYLCVIQIPAFYLLYSYNPTIGRLLISWQVVTIRACENLSVSLGKERKKENVYNLNKVESTVSISLSLSLSLTRSERRKRRIVTFIFT